MSNTATRNMIGDVPHGVQAKIISCASIADLRALTPLPVDAQRLIDQAVVGVKRDRLILADDLLTRGLTYRLPDPLSVMELYWESTDESGFAIRTMLPDARGERQQNVRTGHRIPIYITMDDFSFNVRVLRASERVGAPLDTSMVEQATRNVNEAIEDAAWNGFADSAGNLIKVAGNSCPGVLNAAEVATHQYATGEAWNAAGKTGDEILADIMAMVDELQTLRYFGPFNLYVSTAYNNKLNNDFKANGDKTIRQRIEELETGSGGITIRVSDTLPTHKTALIQMTNDVIDMVVGQTPTEVSWESPGGFNYNAVVMAVMITRLKRNGAGICLGDTV